MYFIPSYCRKCEISSEWLAGISIDRAEFWLEIQYRQQAAETNELADHHAELDNLGVAELFVQAIEKCIVHVVVVQR